MASSSTKIFFAVCFPGDAEMARAVSWLKDKA
jgi:hypothetical protein